MENKGEELKKQLEGLALPMKEGEPIIPVENKQTELDKLEEKAKEFAEKNPGFDYTIITRRPEGMDYDLYKFLRRVSKKAVKNYLKRR
jgi:hypothetical protein